MPFIAKALFVLYLAVRVLSTAIFNGYFATKRKFERKDLGKYASLRP